MNLFRHQLVGMVFGLLALVMPVRVGLANEAPVLTPGEVVRIIVYGRDDLSGEREIDPDGRVLIPLLGRIEAANLSPEVLESRVQAGLQDQKLVDSPRVFIEVMRRRDVFVSGDVEVPGAVGWEPGLTVEQAVTLAGGPRRSFDNALNTLLQAHNSVERFAALEIKHGGLLAQEARLRAEIDFVNLALEEDGDAPTGALNIAVLVPPETAALPVPERADGIARDMVGFDRSRLRAVQASVEPFELIDFPDQVDGEPGLADMRATQQALIEERIAINLTNLHTMQLQLTSLQGKLATLVEQLDVIATAIGPIQEHLDAILNLRQSGLVRSVEVVDLQTALANMLTARLNLITSIADTRIDIQQQELLIRAFPGTLRDNIMAELEAVVTQLSETGSRRAAARRAEVVAQGYLGSETATGRTQNLGYEIVSATSNAPRTADASDLVLPGDTVRVVDLTAR